MADSTDYAADDWPPTNQDWEAYGPPPLPRRVILQFNERLPEYADEVETSFPEYVPETFRELFPEQTIERLYRSLPPDVIESLSAEAEEMDPDYHAPDFLARYAVTLPDDDSAYELGEQLVSFFRDSGFVADAHVELPPGPQPCFAPIHQTLAAPESINAAHAHNSGNRGAGVRIIDVERVWDLTHPDLQSVRPLAGPDGLPAAGNYPAGYTHAADLDHATAMLGLLAADCAAGGPSLMGLIPEAQITVATTWTMTSTGKWVENYADMIKFAAAHLSKGGVLLLEHQIYDQNRTLAPVELESAIWDEIRQAVARGIIVLEPAGNGSANLVDLIANNGLQTFNPIFNPALPDSGAIVVAACRRSAQAVHQPQSKTNRGQRIDCHAWGEQLETLVRADPTISDLWGMTSGAAAVVAGVAALIQSAVLARSRPARTSRQMRDLLATGAISPSIGRLPDLQHILDQVVPNL